MARAKRGLSRLRTVECQICGVPFDTRHSQAKFCPEQCRDVRLRQWWIEYRAKNRLGLLAKSRRSYARHRDAIIRRTDEYKKTPRGKEVVRKTSANMRRKFPEKHAARQAVHVALRSGAIKKKPCRCGATNVQAHHSDYSKPLKIDWLCRPCHRQEHKR